MIEATSLAVYPHISYIKSPAFYHGPNAGCSLSNAQLIPGAEAFSHKPLSSAQLLYDAEEVGTIS